MLTPGMFMIIQKIPGYLLNLLNMTKRKKYGGAFSGVNERP